MVAFRSGEVPETLCVGVMVRVEAKLDTLPRKRPRAARVSKVAERLRALHVLEASAVPGARAKWTFLLRHLNIARVRPSTGGASNCVLDPYRGHVLIVGDLEIDSGRRGDASHGFRIAQHHSRLHLGRYGLDGRHNSRYGHGSKYRYSSRHRYGHGYGYGLGHGSGYGGYASQAVELPSRDILLAALPEGRLDPGGILEGFLYFPVDDRSRSKDRAETSAPLNVSVVHSDTEETLGRFSIP